MCPVKHLHLHFFTGLHLTELSLAETAVTDEGLAAHMRSAHLLKLNLASTPVSNIGVQSPCMT